MCCFFVFYTGNSRGVMLFEGEPDHLSPSTSKIFLQNDMYTMAGRMMGHSFLHGGPRLTGLSPAVLHVLTGGTPQTATIVLKDIADVEIRETIRPVSATADAKTIFVNCHLSYTVSVFHI